MMKRLSLAVLSLFLFSGSLAAAPANPPVPDVLKDRISLQKSAYQLNIVYFLGNDVEPVPDYERRLSELMLYVQQFYGKEMKRNGYGARSFGMDMKSRDRVNFIVYKAKNPASAYPYDNGGGWKAAQEMEEYFKNNPGTKKSQHTLYIMPTWNTDGYGPKNPGGVPFYGLGKSCFALDYPAFDIKHMGQNTKEGRLLTKWYGGLTHELGHGLNLPHNHATKSDEAKYGTALMGAGNYTFGSKPTFLTEASCALLDACEVFSSSKSTQFYQGKPEVETKEVSISFKDNKILISGKFSSPVTVKSLNFYVQDTPYAVNQDYETLSFTKRLKQKSGKFAMTIDRDELIGLTKNEFRVSLRFILENGNHKQFDYIFYKDNLKDHKD